MSIGYHVQSAIDVRGGRLLQVQVFGGNLQPDTYEVYLVRRQDRSGAFAGYQAWYRKTGELYLPEGHREAGAVGTPWWPMLEALHRAAADGDPVRRRAHQLTQQSSPGTWVGASEYLRRPRD